ncbi:hypothetical protein C8Q80DRAFT_1352384 [Daedaleopsis nitida]|nr:hypothetical protein C8Q80DRAFT_1352384 [Daedaleopsis nitida]
MAEAASTTPTNAADNGIDNMEEEEDSEILLMKQRVEEMEREANKLRELQAAAEKAEQSAQGGEQVPMETEEDKAAADGRSIYVGNVDYSATPEEIQQHFQACGTINRVTILCDKFTGHPKGYAYVEFAEAEFIDAALAMDNSLFRGRLIKVTPKRTNIPGFIRGRGRGVDIEEATEEATEAARLDTHHTVRVAEDEDEDFSYTKRTGHSYARFILYFYLSL